jgi:hypothetical protein
VKVREWDLALVGGAAVALAGTAEAAWSLHARFAVDFAGLSALERAGAALWDLRPLGTALFLAGAIVALLSSGARGSPVGDGLALLAAAHAALAVAVLAAAAWVAATGRLGDPDELAFIYSSGERAVTLATQIAAWLPLAVVLVLVAALAIRSEDLAAEQASPAPSPDPSGPDRSLGDEMEELWRERLAYGAGRERARVLLGRIRALEAAGDSESARKLADEMRVLAKR